MKSSNIVQTSIIVGGAILIIILGALLFYTGILSFHVPQEQQQMVNIDEASLEKDMELLAKVPDGFVPIRAFFVDLADRKGGVYAFELLKRAELPPNTDLHLLGHAVGDELYKQEGLDGMKYCTHELRNACSHSIVIGALLKNGLAVFDQINAVCKDAPGGPGAYTMCFHGFGHGVLAYTAYEIPDAIELCDRVGTKEYGNQESAQCIGGMVMEMHQGVHDPELWAQKKDKYLSPDDPLRICNADYMPDYAKVLCFSYITPYIFDAAGAVNGNPRPEIYPESFAYCDTIENDVYRESCYAGLGKEFIVLAQGRDIRSIEASSNDKLMLAASWCMLAEKEEAQTACLIEILDSLFWGGENDPEVSVRYCTLQENKAIRDACFDHLFTIASEYVSDRNGRAHICELVPEDKQSQCEAVLL